MLPFLAAIPVIGELIEKIGGAIDRNVTTDAERLKMKAELAALYAPVLQSLVASQQSMNEMQVRIAEIEAKSEHWIVWARRPIISVLAMTNFILANTLAAFGYAYMDPTDAMYFALLVNGLDTGTRGLEKVVGAFKAREV